MIRGVCGHVWEAKSMSSVILELNLDKHEEIFALPGGSSNRRGGGAAAADLSAAPIVARVSVSSPSLDEMPSSIELWQTRGTDERSMAERFRILPRVEVYHNTFTVVALLHRDFTHLVVGMTGNIRKALPSSPCKHNVIVCVEPALSDGAGGEPTLHPMANRSIPSSGQHFSPDADGGSGLRSGSAAAAPTYAQPLNVVSGPARAPQRGVDESMYYYPGNPYSSNRAAGVTAARQLEPIYPPQAAEAMKSSRFFHRPPQQQQQQSNDATSAFSPAASSSSSPQYVQNVPSKAVLPPAIAPSQQQTTQQAAPRAQEDVQALHFRRHDTSSRARPHNNNNNNNADEEEVGDDSVAVAPAGGGRFLSPSVPHELQFRLPGDPAAAAATPAVKLQNGSAAPSPQRTPSRTGGKPLVLHEEQTQTSRSGSPPQPVIPAPELRQLQMMQQQQAAGARPQSPPPPPPPRPDSPFFRETDETRTTSPFTQALSVKELLSVVCSRMSDWTENMEDLAVLYASKQQRWWQASAAAVRGGGSSSPARRTVSI